MYVDPEIVYNALSEKSQKAFPESYEIVFDNTYRLKNLATQYFVYKANQLQSGGFGAYEFWTYELQSTRCRRCSEKLGVSESEREMFSLAGFPDRTSFLVDFHEWMLDNIQNERPPLAVAEEITQDQKGLLRDIDKLKDRNRISKSEAGPSCADTLLPDIQFAY